MDSTATNWTKIHGPIPGQQFKWKRTAQNEERRPNIHPLHFLPLSVEVCTPVSETGHLAVGQHLERYQQRQPISKSSSSSFSSSIRGFGLDDLALGHFNKE